MVTRVLVEPALFEPLIFHPLISTARPVGLNSSTNSLLAAFGFVPRVRNSLMTICEADAGVKVGVGVFVAVAVLVAVAVAVLVGVPPVGVGVGVLVESVKQIVTSFKVGVTLAFDVLKYALYLRYRMPVN